MEAFLKNHRQAPRKVRLVANLIKGKSVPDALAQLDFVPKRASLPIKKLISSAVANARNNFNVPAEELMIKNVTVDKGPVMRRYHYAPRGAAHRVDKHTSRVTVTLAPGQAKKKGKKVAAKKEVVEAPKAEAAPVKKTRAKKATK